MATAFTNRERELIRINLKKTAKESLGKYGVRRTTVDDLVDKVGISKGSFYNFYKQKEILFFEVLEDYQKSIIDQLVEKLKKEEDIGVDRFTILLYELFQNLRKSFLMNIIEKQEIEYLLGKLPEELIKDHHFLDNLLMKKILNYVNIKGDINVDLIASCLRAIAMNMVYIKEIGEENFDKTLEFLIRGIAIQIIEEGSSIGGGY